MPVWEIKEEGRVSARVSLVLDAWGLLAESRSEGMGQGAMGWWGMKREARCGGGIEKRGSFVTPAPVVWDNGE